MFVAPDPATARLATFLAALRRRARSKAAAHGALAGGLTLLAAAIVGAATGIGYHDSASALALAAGSATGLWRFLALRRTWSTAALAVAAEERLPALRNHLITALELAAHPERASPRIRTRVNAYATRLVEQAPIETVAPIGPMATRLGGAVAAVVLAVGVYSAPWGAKPSTALVGSRTPATGAATPAGISRVDIVVTPPTYAGGAAQTIRDPDRIEAFAGSMLTARVTVNAPSATVDYAGATVRLGRDWHGAATATWPLQSSGLLSIAARDTDGNAVNRRLIPVVSRPDAAPEVVIEQPRSDLVLASATAPVRVTVHATDDLRLASLSLHYTKVTGSGEQYEFDEGELPLTVARERPDRWRGESAHALAGLGLREGDLLVVYARAKDRRPGSEAAVSDSYVIEIGKPQAAIAGGFAVPADEERTAISLSALIRKTERLHEQRTRLPQATVVEAAEGLAVEQRMVRSETLFTLGSHGHIEDEEVEAEQSNEIQEGRLENAGHADLLMAVRLMTLAERQLLAADTAAALRAQRGALVALQRTLSRQRYFLRALAVRGRIDPSRRLTGDISTAQSWRRRGQRAPADDRLAAIRGVLLELMALAGYSGPSRHRTRPADADAAASLAGRVLSLDPGSSALQQSARALSELEGTVSPGRRRDIVAKIVAALEAEAARTPATATPPPAFSTTPLRGAFVDALRQSGDKP